MFKTPENNTKYNSKFKGAIMMLKCYFLFLDFSANCIDQQFK